MKRQPYSLLLLCPLGLACGGLVHAQEIRPPSLVRLGTAHGKNIVCRISLVPLAPKGGEEEVRLDFRACDGAGRCRTFRVAAGECFEGDPATLHISAGDYVRRGRKQIFVSSSYGRTTSSLYDCDGSGAHSLYARAEGRIRVWFQRRNGHWRLVEEWRSDQYQDDENENLGVASVVTAPAGNRMGTVRRTLHWNGHRFVPDHPGPTRTVD